MITINPIASSSAGNAYIIDDGRTSLLLEAGVRFKIIQRSAKFRLSTFGGCLISHEHGDHAKSVKEVLNAGIDCYMSAGTAEALGFADHHRLHIIEAGIQFNVGSWAIMPFGAIHDAIEPLSYLLVGNGGKVLFITDTAYVAPRFQAITHLLIECNYQAEILAKNVENGSITQAQASRLLQSHLSLGTVIEMLKANDWSSLREVYLLHLSSGNSNEAEMKRAVQGVVGVPVYVAGI